MSNERRRAKRDKEAGNPNDSGKEKKQKTSKNESFSAHDDSSLNNIGSFLESRVDADQYHVPILLENLRPLEIRPIRESGVRDLAKEIQDKGWLGSLAGPIIVQQIHSSPTYRVVEGNHRIRALSTLANEKKIPVSSVYCTVLKQTVPESDLIIISNLCNNSKALRVKVTLIDQIEEVNKMEALYKASLTGALHKKEPTNDQIHQFYSSIAKTDMSKEVIMRIRCVARALGKNCKNAIQALINEDSKFAKVFSYSALYAWSIQKKDAGCVEFVINRLCAEARKAHQKPPSASVQRMDSLVVLFNKINAIIKEFISIINKEKLGDYIGGDQSKVSEDVIDGHYDNEVTAGENIHNLIRPMNVALNKARNEKAKADLEAKKRAADEESRKENERNQLLQSESKNSPLSTTQEVAADSSGVVQSEILSLEEDGAEVQSAEQGSFDSQILIVSGDKKEVDEPASGREVECKTALNRSISLECDGWDHILSACHEGSVQLVISNGDDFTSTDKHEICKKVHTVLTDSGTLCLLIEPTCMESWVLAANSAKLHAIGAPLVGILNDIGRNGSLKDHRNQTLFALVCRKGETHYWKQNGCSTHSTKRPYGNVIDNITTLREERDRVRDSDNLKRLLADAPYPQDWIESLIVRFTRLHDKVVDFRSGSGLVGLACLKLRRRFAGGDSDANRINLAQKVLLEIYMTLVNQGSRDVKEDLVSAPSQKLLTQEEANYTARVNTLRSASKANSQEDVESISDEDENFMLRFSVDPGKYYPSTFKEDMTAEAHLAIEAARYSCEIKKSSIADAGLGVFFKKPMKKGESWLPVWGNLMTGELREKIQKENTGNHMLLDLGGVMLLDMHEASVARKVNDGRKSGRKVNVIMRRNENCRLEEMKWDMILMELIEDVNIGDEALTDYGQQFWKESKN